MYGYMGTLGRVDLNTGKFTEEHPEEEILRKYIGGTGLGAYYLYREVPRGTKWSDPENLFMVMAGPLSGGPGPFGTVSVVTQGALTGSLGSAQTNGKMGAFLRFCGYDGIILHGRSPRPVYLYIHEDAMELHPADELMGLDTWETTEAIEKELGLDELSLSVLAIGPAGEHGVNIAATCTERGHITAHNGVGAVMGAKNLKAIAVRRGSKPLPYADYGHLQQTVMEVLKEKSIPNPNGYAKYGTSRAIISLDNSGMLPVKNYTSDEGYKYYFQDGVNYEERFEKEHIPCWGCMFKHCHRIKVKDGKLKGMVGEEQEYEGVSGLGTNICMGSVAETQMLGNWVDKYCMDANEIGWILGWLMECYDRGICTREDLDGLEMTWGNYEASVEMVRKIAYRDGIGDVLANGLAYAATHLWNGAGADYGVYTLKGNTPRGHDHRQTFNHLLDTCTGGIGTDEIGVLFPNNRIIGLPDDTDKTTPEGCAKIVAACYRKGVKTCFDSFPACFCGLTGSQHTEMLKILRAAVGPDWDIDEEELSNTCMRISTLGRAFGCRNSEVTVKEKEWPSKRYASAVIKGPLTGKCMMDIYGETLDCFYREMGWDVETGKPLPETLRALNLDYVIPDLWPEEGIKDEHHIESAGSKE